MTAFPRIDSFLLFWTAVALLLAAPGAAQIALETDQGAWHAKPQFDPPQQPGQLPPGARSAPPMVPRNDPRRMPPAAELPADPSGEDADYFPNARYRLDGGRWARGSASVGFDGVSVWSREARSAVMFFDRNVIVHHEVQSKSGKRAQWAAIIAGVAAAAAAYWWQDPNDGGRQAWPSGVALGAGIGGGIFIGKMLRSERHSVHLASDRGRGLDLSVAPKSRSQFIWSLEQMRRASDRRAARRSR